MSTETRKDDYEDRLNKAELLMIKLENGTLLPVAYAKSVEVFRIPGDEARRVRITDTLNKEHFPTVKNLISKEDAIDLADAIGESLGKRIQKPLSEYVRDVEDGKYSEIILDFLTSVKLSTGYSAIEEIPLCEDEVQEDEKCSEEKTRVRKVPYLQAPIDNGEFWWGT